MIKHIRRWNIWRKGCLNSKFHKFLVLFGIVKSATMAFIILPEEQFSFDDMCRRNKNE